MHSPKYMTSMLQSEISQAEHLIQHHKSRFMSLHKRAKALLKGQKGKKGTELSLLRSKAMRCFNKAREADKMIKMFEHHILVNLKEIKELPKEASHSVMIDDVTVPVSVVELFDSSSLGELDYIDSSFEVDCNNTIRIAY